MATLTTGQQAFVVTALAQFNTPTEVVELVKQEFGLEVSRQQVAYYDPSSRATGTPAKRWRELHEEARKRYIENVEEVALAHERYRLETLQRVLRRRLEVKDDHTVLDVLEQAAKERGRVYTNVRDIQSKGEKVPDIFVFGSEEEEDGT